MELTEKYSDVGLALKHGFPEFYHVFNHGALTADIGRNGGIDTLGFIDVRQENGMIFPNRWYSHVLNRENWHLGRPMYGAAVKFISRTSAGVVYYHSPREGRLLPYGVISRQCDTDFGTNAYHLFLERDRTLRLILKNDSKNLDTLDIMVSKYHLVQGKYMIRQNQLIEHEYGVEMLAKEQLYDSYLRREPFANISGELKWTETLFDKSHNALVFSGMREYEDGHRSPLFMVFGCSAKCTFKETPQNWQLRCNWRNRGIAVSIAIGETLPSLLERVGASCNDVEKRLERLLEDSSAIEKSSPKIVMSALAEAEDFSRYVRGAQSALTIEEETGKYAAILASSGRFGYFVAWDHNYPIRDFITTGDFAEARRLLRYAIDYPHMKTAPFSVFQIILETSELISFEGTREFLDEVWPTLVDEFDFLKNFVDGETGLLKATHCCGVDNPAEVGLSRFFFAACLNAWYYAAQRTMANFALLLNQETYATQISCEAEKLQANYLKYFYNYDVGALRVAVNDDLTLPAIEVFHNSSSIGLDYPYGEYLLRHAIDSIARYYKSNLQYPEGYTAIAYDSASPCEMWRNVYMNQHIGHNTRIARLNNDTQEAFRVAQHYFSEFRATGTAIETFNLEGCEGDISQRTKWQAFSATGALHCLHQSLAGIAWSRGGLAFLPADDTQKIDISQFCFGGHSWHVEIVGEGSFVSNMKVNGQDIIGSMQIPADISNDRTIHWEITRSSQMWETPVLLYATDLPIRNLMTTEHGIHFIAASTAFAPLKFFAPAEIIVAVNGKEIPVEYTACEHTAWVNGFFQTGDHIECRMKTAKGQLQR